VKQILVYEPFADPVLLSQLVFLLKLADYFCLEARDSNQMLNWVCMIQQQRITCDLVLISSLEEKDNEDLFLEKIAQLDVPVLFIQRGTMVPEPLRDKAIACEPIDLFIYL